MRIRSWSALMAVALLLGAGCAQQAEEPDAGASPTPADGEVSLSIGDVPDSVQGNVVEIPVTVEGIEIVKADGDTSGETGHYHVFIDKDPVAVGEKIPVGEAGIVHSAEAPIKLWGLSEGEHTATVVLGDGTHTRIHEGVEEEVTFTVAGPTVDASVESNTVPSGQDLTISLSSTGVEIVKADGDTSGDTGHYHVLIDPATPPKAGETIPPAEEGKIIHTTESSVKVSGLAQGEHTIYVVLGDGNHVAFDPLVGDKLTVTVQ